MIYRASEIAKYIIYYERFNRRYINNLRLQKLLYFIQGKFLLRKKEPCFSDKIEAWDFGPIVYTVYREYCYYGLLNIPIPEKSYFLIEKEDKELINSFLDYCADYSTSTLAEITRSQPPWQKAHNRISSKEISIDSMYNYFTENKKEK